MDMKTLMKIYKYIRGRETMRRSVSKTGSKADDRIFQRVLQEPDRKIAILFAGQLILSLMIVYKEAMYELDHLDLIMPER